MRQRLTVDSAFAALARFVVRFRVAVVCFWLLAAVLLSATLPSLGSQVNNDNSAFLPASSPSSRATSLAGPLLGGLRRSQIVVLATTSGPALNAGDQAAIARELAAVRALPHVTSAREAGLSADGRAAQIRIRVAASAADLTVQKEVVDNVQATFVRVAQPPAGVQFHLAGQIATAVANQDSTKKASGQIQTFSLLFIILLLGFVFRAPLAALVTVVPSGLALLIATRLIGGLGSAGLKISGFAQFLLIVLLLGAGTDYGLFLVFRVREELHAGRSPHDAVIRALSRVGESITASAGTVILALLTLLLASFGLYHDLGIPLAVGVAVILLAGLTLLPALLAIFGRAAFWPRRIQPGQQTEGAWSRVARRAVQRPALTLGIGVAAFLALAAGALGYSSSGFGGATAAPSGSDAAAGNAALSQHFPQSSANPADLIVRYTAPIYSDSSPVSVAAAGLRASGAFTRLSGPLNANGTALTPNRYAQLHARLGPPAALPVLEPAGLHIPPRDYSAYRASAQLVSPDGRTVEFEASLAAGSQQTTQAMNATPAVRRILAQVARRSGASASGVAGQAAASYDISTTANGDLVRIVPVAVLAIALLLALVLRSLVAPLYLIASVALSYLAALGLATIAFVAVGGDSGLVFILPFLMFVFLLALGEDYNILVMTRIREEARQFPLREAVVRAVGRTGSTVTSAGLILGGTFGVLAIAGSGANSGQIQAIGFGLAVGILMDTFLVRTLLVPSLIILLGRWNWWPSAMGRRDEPAAPAGPGALSSAWRTLDAPDAQ